MTLAIDSIPPEYAPEYTGEFPMEIEGVPVNVTWKVVGDIEKLSFTVSLDTFLAKFHAGIEITNLCIPEHENEIRNLIYSAFLHRSDRDE